MKVYKAFAVLILAFFSIHLFIPIVNAHKTYDKIWFLINNEFRLTETSTPNSSTLLWSEHYVNETFKTNEIISLELIKDNLPENSKINGSLISYRILTTFPYNVKNNNKVMKAIHSEDFYVVDIFNPKINLTFETEGDYYFSLMVENDRNEILEREDFKLTVGDRIDQPQLVINDEVIERNNVNKQIKRSDTFLFSVGQADFENYKYTLDLGNSSAFVMNDLEENSLMRGFMAEKMPLYIILRKENKSTHVSADTYVRLYTEEEETFKVLPPSATINNVEQRYIDYRIAGLIIGSLVVGFIYLYKRLRKPKSVV